MNYFKVIKWNNFEIDFRSSTPLHRQLLDLIRHLILSGELKAEEKLPSEKELTHFFNVSRNTVRQALAQAVNEGLITKVPGLGTFVNKNNPYTVSGQLIALISTLSNRVYLMELMGGAELVARKHSYQMIVSNSNRNIIEENKIYNEFVAKKIAGLLMWPVWQNTSIEQNDRIWKRSTIPIVLLDRHIEGADFDCVLNDNYNAMKKAVRHLADLGHRDIAFICRNLFNLEPIQERLKGFRDAITELQLPYREPWIIGEPDIEVTIQDFYNNKSTENEVKQIANKLSQKDRPQALVIMNDILAAKVVRAVKMVGLKVPDDISIVGFDDTALSAREGILLTSVIQDMHTMGKIASELLFERLNGSMKPVQSIEVPAHLLIQHSTATPRSSNPVFY